MCNLWPSWPPICHSLGVASVSPFYRAPRKSHWAPQYGVVHIYDRVGVYVWSSFSIMLITIPASMRRPMYSTKFAKCVAVIMLLAADPASLATKLAAVRLWSRPYDLFSLLFNQETAICALALGWSAAKPCSWLFDASVSLSIDCLLLYFSRLTCYWNVVSSQGGSLFHTIS